ncbi:hypothetical protein CERZMDRAFT_67890 [Cercospora zeae-maydis SCOH1-5]|uniref:Pseudouridine-5'-phosphate glycosidase n=1 Tax=Cercospora zeae-maydis SCOH1-5 TaxID=717836 RepID=A0A6A6FG42_9PEZI|nr:hypothetical protein CERZMDRAFT_67890 [Cercospora zeae-maydis SCOH1-5]
MLTKAVHGFARGRCTLVGVQSSIRHYSHGDCLRISSEVRDAVSTGKPVVALETTVYTHGYPRAEWSAMPQVLESIVREEGAVPATIGVLNGIAHVGMSRRELDMLTICSKAGDAMKIARRDLSYICGLGISGKPINGGTTISATIALAHAAGIRILGTSGLGGVHRGAEHTMDISADLVELGRTPVSVVSSGCKSFLDIDRTMEYLETQSVCVATFADGRTGDVDFPAYFMRDSGVKSPLTVDSEVEAASMIHAQRKLGISAGTLLANPITEKLSIPAARMNAMVDAALHAATESAHTGSSQTPFVQARLKDMSGEDSIIANRVLTERNVRLAARVAVQLARLESR